MQHAEFVRAWRAGGLSVTVNRSKALQIANSSILPRKYQAAHHFWSWVWMLSIPAAFAVMWFYTWWAGLLILAFVTPAISHATKTSAMQFMIDYAVESPDFYRRALSAGVLRIHHKGA